MLTDRPEWIALRNHRAAMEGSHMRDLFRDDPNRFARYSLDHDGLMLDFSKNRITDETLALLTDLARACAVEIWRDRMFEGAPINNSENRAVLHTALRGSITPGLSVDGEDVYGFVARVLGQMQQFSDAVRSGDWTGHTGKAIRTVVNIGIGGSDLGPKMVCDALKNIGQSRITVRFVSNIDGADLAPVLAACDPETTLFVIASKTFTTQETMTNAASAKDWLLERLTDEKAVARHFIALSTNEQAVRAFGIAPEAMFPFRDWVGGRYSLWSSIGLSICIACGFENFCALLDGARAMDTHFQQAPLSRNMPVLLGLLGIWYRNFWDMGSYAVLPYSQDLDLLPAFLQQLDMESNGKNVDRDGTPLTAQSGPVLFGAAGTNGQHSFYQLIHQGTNVIPCDFIGLAESPSPLTRHHEILLANMLAQSQALMQGRMTQEAGGDPRRAFPGNRPSNTILLDRLDPYRLGMLIALYEHKVFVQGIIWNINSFDQWGVELGKVMAKATLSALAGGALPDNCDSSTAGLIDWLHTRAH